MKKHAILIMAHNQFELLKHLLQMLDHDANDIYIHIDKKAGKIDEEHLRSICKKSSIFFIPRMRLFWGHSSLVECELRLMEAALNSCVDYSYLHLLSGVDLQIKSTEEIHKFFELNAGQEFVALRNAASGVDGINRFYFFMPLRAYNKYLAKGLDMLSSNIQKLLKVNRLKNKDILLCKTQQWFSITKECAAYVVSQRKFIAEFTRFTSCSDEMFLGTVIVNSKFRDSIYEPYRSPGGHMRLIDRTRPEKASPHTWTMEDWNMIAECPYFWARKFDINKDHEVIEKVIKTWG